MLRHRRDRQKQLTRAQLEQLILWADQGAQGHSAAETTVFTMTSSPQVKDEFGRLLDPADMVQAIQLAHWQSQEAWALLTLLPGLYHRLIQFEAAVNMAISNLAEMRTAGGRPCTVREVAVVENALEAVLPHSRWRRHYLYRGTIDDQDIARVAFINAGRMHLPDEQWQPLPHRPELRGLTVAAEDDPAPYRWGYGGTGPTNLAMALCAHHLENFLGPTDGPAVAVMVYRRFKGKWVAAQNQGRPWASDTRRLHAVIEECLQEESGDG